MSSAIAKKRDISPEQFRDFLRKLQSDGPYNWPNLYFAWEKPDGTLFMVGTASNQMHQLLKYEFQEPPHLKALQTQFPEAKDSFAGYYGATHYDIAPSVRYQIGDRCNIDPVEELMSQVAEYHYLGAWEDPDKFLKDGYNLVRAQGRWDLAKEHIFQAERSSSLDDMIQSAVDRAVSSSVKPSPKRDSSRDR